MTDARAYIVTLALFACLFADWLNVPLFRHVRYAAHGVSLRGVRRVHAASSCMSRASLCRCLPPCYVFIRLREISRGYGGMPSHSPARVRICTFAVVVRSLARFATARKSLIFAGAFCRSGVALCPCGQVGRQPVAQMRPMVRQSGVVDKSARRRAAVPPI